MNTTKRMITGEEAFASLKNGERIQNCIIGGTLNFNANDFEQAVVLHDCMVENLEASNVQFNKPVRFVNCHFKQCDFAFTYFLKGLEITRCLFEGYLDFQSGGHNKPANKFSVSDSTFKEFVNFFDCAYEGPVIITGNKFEKGTNILGNQNQPFVTSFEDTVLIEGNLGELNIDVEGEA